MNAILAFGIDRERPMRFRLLRVLHRTAEHAISIAILHYCIVGARISSPRFIVHFDNFSWFRLLNLMRNIAFRLRDQSVIYKQFQPAPNVDDFGIGNRNARCRENESEQHRKQNMASVHSRTVLGIREIESARANRF
ncbi:hypothetical protein M4951_05895 [Blastopirellula sp. J2-11]|uniref:hypothetical protein n=1 Tax=Blastopirellula sp. J2-11 TaxID=2943192 RepID=UPI0021C98437|nr:hypothetical protein [Blastopirellula sp. J2-11]UUO07842.1 hypothetical protein M4951_05895 [Blastopirellula sp. J2-11]